MNRDDADERQARIDSLIDQVRMKFDRTRELAGRAREEGREAHERLRTNALPVGRRHRPQKKAG